MESKQNQNSVPMFLTMVFNESKKTPPICGALRYETKPYHLFFLDNPQSFFLGHARGPFPMTFLIGIMGLGLANPPFLSAQIIRYLETDPLKLKSVVRFWRPLPRKEYLQSQARKGRGFLCGLLPQFHLGFRQLPRCWDPYWTHTVPTYVESEVITHAQVSRMITN